MFTIIKKARIPPWLQPKKILIFFSITILFLNCFSLAKELHKMHKTRQRKPYIFLGFQFLGIGQRLKDQEFIGYYTDRNLDVREAAMQFSQAQYILAPIILDIDNLKHKYIIFDCKDKALAAKKIKALGAVKLGENAFGIILALRYL